jgi:hypothetical protein
MSPTEPAIDIIHDTRKDEKILIKKNLKLVSLPTSFFLDEEIPPFLNISLQIIPSPKLIMVREV